MAKGNDVRQGDVYIVPLDEALRLYKGLKVNFNKETATKIDPVAGRAVVALGESTGHYHSLDADVVTLYKPDDLTEQFFSRLGLTAKIVVADAPTVMTHFGNDHDPVPVLEGVSIALTQRQYTPAAPVRVGD